MRFALVTLMLIAVAWLNVDYYRRSWRMSPDERAADDEETRRELSIW